MPNKKAKRKLVANLFMKQKFLCYWCDKKLIMYQPSQLSNGIVPDNAATLDHLYERFDPRRYKPYEPGETIEDRHVCACSKCNGKRGLMKWLQLSKLERLAHMSQPRSYWPQFYLQLFKAETAPATKVEAKPKNRIKYPPLPPVPKEEQGERNFPAIGSSGTSLG